MMADGQRWVRRLVLIAVCSCSFRGEVLAQAHSAPGVIPLPPVRAPATVANLPTKPEAPPGSEFGIWWDQPVSSPLKSDAQPLGLTLDDLVLGTLINSPRLRVAADFPVARQTTIQEADARFDMQTFVDSRFTDTSDPVGNLLTTGGAPRFIDQTWVHAGGVRRTTRSGAQVEIAQRFGYQDNNSIYFVPAPQGTSRIVMTATQPLLNGRGKAYNTSLVVLAEVMTGKANDDLQRELQELLMDVYEAYWDVRLQRAVWLQRKRLYDRAIAIRNELRERRDFDVLGSQVVRAEAAVAERDAAVIRLRTSVDNAEARLRALLNDPRLQIGPLELIPIQQPQRILYELDLPTSLTQALEARPEIRAAFKDIRAATVRAEVSKNEMLPVLNFVLSSYVAGLAGQANIGQSWLNQFTLGRPTYSTGLQFEVPWGRRAASARLQQRLIELRQATNHLQEVTIQVRTDVEITVREVSTTFKEMNSRRQAMRAAQAEVDYLTDRWRLLPGDQQVAGIMLDNLLHAHERLADAEQEFAAAEAAYNVALVAVHRATGSLLQYTNVQQLESCENGLRALQFDTPGRGTAIPGPTTMPSTYGPENVPTPTPNWIPHPNSNGPSLQPPSGPTSGVQKPTSLSQVPATLSSGTPIVR